MVRYFLRKSSAYCTNCDK